MVILIHTYNHSLSKSNSIAYCHFPSAKFYLQSYDKLKEMIIDLKLVDYVTFENYVNLDKLLSFMQKSEAYFTHG